MKVCVCVCEFVRVCVFMCGGVAVNLSLVVLGALGYPNKGQRAGEYGETDYNTRTSPDVLSPKPGLFDMAQSGQQWVILPWSELHPHQLVALWSCTSSITSLRLHFPVGRIGLWWYYPHRVVRSSVTTKLLCTEISSFMKMEVIGATHLEGWELGNKMMCECLEPCS